MFPEKPFAPKPVKRYSNNLGIKLNTGFDRVIDVSSHNSLSVRGGRRINLENPNSPDTKKIKSIQTFAEGDNFRLFKSGLECSKSEEYAKVEIFSILSRTDSTLYASLNGKTESLEGDENRMTSNPTDEENCKMTFPPIRIKNPFSKNFYCYRSEEEQEVDLNVINFKSKIFGRDKD